ncbi:MAG TPA: di-heme oxidoredictase family protein [Terriglobales bacterium]|nr:di-heme oxidoredictase family protein [Terriglobales bacterium]
MKTSILFVAFSSSLLITQNSVSPANSQARASALSEAPSSFDGQTIDPAFVTQAVHDNDKAFFDEVEDIDKDGLGPLYNAQSCRECHQNPASGGASQVVERRAGHRGPNGQFVSANVSINNGEQTIVGRTLINDRAICPNAANPDVQLQEHMPDAEKIRTNRISLSVLGDGFIEAVADQTLIDLADKQCRTTKRKICGQALPVPIVEAKGKTGIGRFGWKDQHASLLSFAGDAYLNEMGITNTLFPDEVTNLCNPKTVTEPNSQPDPKDGLEDIDHFARFMRASKAPPRDEKLAATPAAKRGAEVFEKIGCGICHVPALQTAKAGTTINGGKFTVPEALGEKQFHPFSDFLLHDVGTGDGIAIAVVEHYRMSRQVAETIASPNYSPRTVDQQVNREHFSFKAIQDAANKLRTPPLWGVRTHARLMHDGDSLTMRDAILRHRGEASEVTRKFIRLPPKDKSDLLSFLNSL